MNLKRFVPLLLSFAILLSVVAVSSNTNESLLTGSADISTGDTAKSEADNTESSADEADSDEMLGVWVSYMELDMQSESDKSESAFRKKFMSIAEKSAAFGFNTLIVQVRPFGDALYDSKYFPWSHILTGTQGKNPNYDPLEIMCEICREKGLKIHAWVNPYRISTNETPSHLSADNPYKADSTLGKTTDSGIYYDPSNEEARELIVNGVAEIAENYDVDGIQYDDYFYPTDDESFDEEEYEAYVSEVGKNNSMSLENWRNANVNLLVCETYRAVHNAKEDAVFGISPQGNIENNKELYADVKSWCACRGFIDYICPQIYFSLTNPALTFEDSLKSWTELDYAENVSLYIGLAGYKAGSDDDEGTWENDDDILSEEYKIVLSNETTSGIMLYSFASLTETNAEEEMKNLSDELNLN